MIEKEENLVDLNTTSYGGDIEYFSCDDTDLEAMRIISRSMLENLV